MKKFTLLLLALAAMLNFTSCSDDDDDFNIVGTWKYDKVEIALKSNNGKSDAIVKKYIEDFSVGDYDGEFITFKADDTFIDADGDTGVYVIKNNILTITWDDYPDNVSYNISGNKLVISYKYDNEDIEDLIMDMEYDEIEVAEGYVITSLETKDWFVKK